MHGSAHLRLSDIIGPYKGGSGNAEGEYQNDVHLIGGLSFRVR